MLFIITRWAACNSCTKSNITRGQGTCVIKCRMLRSCALPAHSQPVAPPLGARPLCAYSLRMACTSNEFLYLQNLLDPVIQTGPVQTRLLDSVSNTTRRWHKLAPILINQTTHARHLASCPGPELPRKRLRKYRKSQLGVGVGWHETRVLHWPA